MDSEREVPARVLIVDDERYNRELLKVMLAPEGFEVVTATSGEDALQIIRDNAPDLILLDALMPGMDGYELARRVKERHSTRSIPIIMVSALDDRDSRLLGLSAGAEDFLAKPIDRFELSIRIRNLLRLKAYSDHLGKYSETLEAEVAARSTRFVERRKSPEARISANEERTAFAMGAAGIGVWEIDMATDQLTWSENMPTVFGVASAPATGLAFLALVHPDDRSMVVQTQANCVRLHQDMDIEYRVIRAGGGAHWIAMHARCIYSELGAPTRLIGICTDIDQRKSPDLEGTNTNLQLAK